MGVALHTKSNSFEIGTGAFLSAFFDTIYVRLTKGLFGKKYPCVMNHLCYGELKYEQLYQAKDELKNIQSNLKKFTPNKIVWDKMDLTKSPPWGDNISKEITDLSNYFVTSEGKDLFEVFFKAIESAIEEKCNLIIR